MKLNLIAISVVAGLAGMTLSGCVNHAAGPEYNGSYYIWQLQKSSDRVNYPDRDYDPPNR